MRLMPSVAALVAAFAAWTQLRLNPHTERSCPCLEPQYLWGYQTHEMPSLEGQVAIVTGANVGLGLSTAKLLLQKGATVVMGCRRMGSCNDAKESLRNKIPNLDQAVPMHIDLSSLKSVSSFVENFERQFDRLDVIVLNAAVFPVDYAVATETQLELAFSVNHVGHFLLTTQLLQRYAEPMVSLGGIKVSVVSSNHHFFSYDPPLWISPPEQGLANASLFDSNAAYGHSKLANIYFAQELTRRLDRQGLDHIFVNSAHPGGVRTNLLRDWQEFADESFGIPLNWSEYMLDIIVGSILFDPDDAALTVLYTVTSPDIEAQDIKGKYFVPIAHIGQRSHLAADESFQRSLWTYTDDLLESLGYERSGF